MISASNLSSFMPPTVQQAEKPGKLQMKVFERFDTVLKKSAVKASVRPAAIKAAEYRNDGKKPSKDVAAEKEDAFEKNVVEKIARDIGVGSDELKIIMMAAGITPVQLKDPEGIKEAAARFSEYLGLNDIQKTAVTGLILNAVKEASQSMISSKGAQLNTAAKSVDNCAGQAPLQKEGTDIKQLFQQEHQAEYNQVIQKLQEAAGPRENIQLNVKQLLVVDTRLMQEISQKVKAAVETAAARAAEAVKPLEADRVVDRVVDGVVDRASKAAGEKAGEKKEEPVQDSLPLQAKLDKGGQLNGKIVDIDIQAGREVKNHDVYVKVTGAREKSADKYDVLNQVIEKAKLILTQDKSEMVINLKPDHLGKLSLKVITERGMVMAQFSAESQRVKEIIETNMQLLKETLKNQGIAVQDFSVSVGQESFRDTSGRQELFSRSGSIRPSFSNAAVRNSSMETIEKMAGKSNVIMQKYGLTGSSIDCTA